MPVLPIRPSRSTSASSPSRDAPSSLAQRRAARPRSRPLDLDRAAALEAHAQVAHDRPADVERLRRRDDAVGAQRVGRRGDLLGRQVRRVDHAVDRLHAGRRRSAKREVGSRPTVRSVPGPSKRSASKLRASSARARVVQLPEALAPRRRRVGLVEPQHVDELLPERAPSPSSSSSPGCTRRAHSGVAHGTTHQFVVLALITSKFSLIAGSWSRPARAGSMPSSSPGGMCGVIEMREPCARRARAAAAPYHGGHEVERVLGRLLERGSA